MIKTTVAHQPPGRASAAPYDHEDILNDAVCENIDWQALPSNLLRLRGLLGPKAALALAATYGGGAVYVPRSPAAGHPLRSLLGDEDLLRLTGAYGGERLEIPKLDAVHRQLRKKRIFSDREQGRSLSELAARYNLSRRRILQILAE